MYQVMANRWTQDQQQKDLYHVWVDDPDGDLPVKGIIRLPEGYDFTGSILRATLYIPKHGELGPPIPHLEWIWSTHWKGTAIGRIIYHLDHKE